MTASTTRAVRALKAALLKDSSTDSKVSTSNNGYPWLKCITPEEKEKSDIEKRNEKLEARRQKRYDQFCIGAHMYSNHEWVVENLPNVPIV